VEATESGINGASRRPAEAEETEAGAAERINIEAGSAPAAAEASGAGTELPGISGELAEPEAGEEAAERPQARSNAAEAAEPPPQPGFSAPLREGGELQDNEGTSKGFDGEESDVRPPKRSRYAPMSALGTALSLFVMGIPLVGFIVTVVWACGACRKIGRRNLARAVLILMALGFILSLAAALLIRFVFAEDITRMFESMFPGYTIDWG
jgi:hypothetical protein